MRITIVNNGLSGGGIERASTSLSNYFSQQGHEVNILSLYQSVPFFSLEPSINFKEPDFPYTNKYLHTLRVMFWLRNQVLLNKPDVILAFGESTNPYVVFALSGLNIPVFVTDRMHPKARLPRLTFWLKKKMYPKASGIIVQTQLAKTVISTYNKNRKIFVIPNPVNIIEPLEVEKKKIIVSVGRLEKVKGHEYLIRAFAKIRNNDWSLSIVGDGSLKHYLQALAQELNVGNRVVFHGHKKNFNRELSQASIFVLPSVKEGFPNALLEAMALPMACIATDFMGAKNELIDDGKNGYVVPVMDATELAKRIQHLIDNPKKRDDLAQKAKDVREKYAFSNIAKRFEDALRFSNE